MSYTVVRAKQDADEQTVLSMPVKNVTQGPTEIRRAVTLRVCLPLAE